MIWIAPSEKDTATGTLEKHLWDAADQFRPKKCEVRVANSEVPSVRQSTFVLRHWHGLPAEARFDYLLNRPEAENIGAKVNAAMRDVAKCEVRVANSEVQSVRHSKFVIRNSQVSASLDSDAFGRIHEYFLAPWERVAAPAFSGPVRGSPTGRGEFAMSEGEGGGEFHTPSSIVRLLTEVIEPYHGRVLDPACEGRAGFLGKYQWHFRRLLPIIPVSTYSEHSHC